MGRTILALLSGGLLVGACVIRFGTVAPKADRDLVSSIVVAASAAAAVPLLIAVLRSRKRLAPGRGIGPEPRPWYRLHPITLAACGYTILVLALLSITVRSYGRYPDPKYGVTYVYLGWPLQAIMIIDKGANIQEADNVNWPGPVRPGTLAVDLLVAGLTLAGISALCERSLRRANAPAGADRSQAAAGRKFRTDVPEAQVKDQSTTATDGFIRFPCPGCGKSLKAKREYAGRRVKCSGRECGQTVQVPCAAPGTSSSDDVAVR